MQGRLGLRRVIVAVTRNRALAMNRQEGLSTVEAGKAPDVLILAADPVAEVSDFRQREAVIRGGRFHSRHSLQRPERGVY
jgi:imidazolonepropionase-like amidohydrolase